MQIGKHMRSSKINLQEIGCQCTSKTDDVPFYGRAGTGKMMLF